MPKTALLTDKIAVLRAVVTHDNAHSSSGYQMLTGVPHIPLNAESVAAKAPNLQPSLGAIVQGIAAGCVRLPAAMTLPEHIWNDGNFPWPGRVRACWDENMIVVADVRSLDRDVSAPRAHVARRHRHHADSITGGNSWTHSTDALNVRPPRSTPTPMMPNRRGACFRADRHGRPSSSIPNRRSSVIAMVAAVTPKAACSPAAWWKPESHWCRSTGRAFQPG